MIERQRQAVQNRLRKAASNPIVFEAGQLVLVEPRDSQPRSKLDVNWLGPDVVVERNHESYKCQDMANHEVYTFTTDRIKEYREDIQVPAHKVATWGSRMYEVEKFVEHKAGATRAKWQFKVRVT